MDLILFLVISSLNGLLLQSFFLKEYQQGWERVLLAIVLSLSINGIGLYGAIFAAGMPLTRGNVLGLSFGIAASIVGVGILQQRRPSSPKA